MAAALASSPIKPTTGDPTRRSLLTGTAGLALLLMTVPTLLPMLLPTLLTTSVPALRAQPLPPLRLATATPCSGFALCGETLQRVLNAKAGRELPFAVPIGGTDW